MATQGTTHLAEIVGANIAAARTKAGLTQQELATEIESSVSRVSGWETGKHLPSPRKQARLAARLFDGDTTALFREADPEPVAA